MDRTQFIEQQTLAADEKFAQTSGEESARERYLQLAIDTYDFLISTGADFVLVFDPWPESAGNPLRGPLWGKRNDSRRIELSPALIQRCEGWNREYFELRARNLQLELRDMMQEISESHMSSSWPEGYERLIQDWVDAGDLSARPPFDDGHNIVTPEFFNRLRELRRLCGGWLFWSSDLERVVFAPEAQWQQVRATEDAAEAKRRNELEESKAKSERLAQRASEIVAIARSDNTFWGALRMWELEREAKRPSGLPTLERSPGALWLETRSLPLDPIFAEFIARVRSPDEVLTALDIVLILRSEMRRELGLEVTMGWPGGPGIGVAQLSRE